MARNATVSNRRNGPTGRVTLVQVAREAGVAVSTASTILSGRQEAVSLFRDDTVQRVRRTAKKLGYQANLFASALPVRSSSFFALVVRDFGRANPEAWHAWAFEGQFLAGITGLAAKNQLYPILATIDPLAEDAGVAATERVIAGGVLGAIVRAQNPPLEKFLHTQIENARPIVVVFPDQISKWHSNAIVADNIAIGEHAGRLLAKAGRKNWAFIRYKNRKLRESHKLRREGFLRVAKEAGVNVKTIMSPDMCDDIAEFAVGRLKSGHIDGIFAADSVLSINWLLACQRTGHTFGENLSLVGVNCSKWPHARLPQITSIDVSWQQVGKIAMEQLLALARSDEQLFDTITIQPEIVPGETCPMPG